MDAMPGRRYGGEAVESMALTLKQVATALGWLREDGLKQAARVYEREILRPILAAIRKKRGDAGDDATDLQALAAELPAVLGRIDDEKIVAAIAPLLAQADVIGQASATPSQLPDQGLDESPIEEAILNLAALERTHFRPKKLDQISRMFGTKIPLTSTEFDAISREAKARAFRIAGVNKASLIQKALNEVKKAVRDGTSYPDLQVRLARLFSDAGLEGFPMTRLRIVMSQNMNTAYTVARKRVLERPAVQRSFPFWQYVTVGNGRAGVNNVRPEHAALHNEIFRADDPVWKRIYPPWGWGCRCNVRPLTPGQVRRLGGEAVVKDAEYAFSQIPVPGSDQKGVKPSPEFDFERDQFMDKNLLQGLDSTIRGAVEEAMRRAEDELSRP